MRFYQAGYVGEVLDPFALSPSWVAPRADLACKRVIQRRYTHQDTVNICGYPSARKVPVEVFGSELNADLGTSLKVDRPLKLVPFEAGIDETLFRTLDRVCRDDKVDVLSDHLIVGPIINGNSADRAPNYVGAFECVYKPHHVVCAAESLPIVELLLGHIVRVMIYEESTTGNGGENGKHIAVPENLILRNILLIDSKAKFV